MIRSELILGFILAFMMILLVSFQNCSGGKGTNLITSRSEQAPPKNDDNENEESDNDNFKAGDPFSANKLPYTPQGRLIQDLVDYPGWGNFKALAVAKNGVGLGMTHQKFTSQQEANQIVLENCQILANNNPCALFAEGDKIKFDESDFYKNHNSVLSNGGTVDFSKIPMMFSVDEATRANAYSTSTNTYKSIAIAMYGAVVLAYSNFSQADSNRRALQDCEAITDDFCTLYAEGTNVVFNVGNFNWNYVVKYLEFGPATFVLNKVPFITEASYSNIAQIPTLTANGQKPVLALSRQGHYWLTWNSNESIDVIRERALTNCSNQIDSTLKCVVYSENDQVVFSKDDLLNANP